MRIFECFIRCALSVAHQISYLEAPPAVSAQRAWRERQDGVSRRGDGGAGRSFGPGRKNAAAGIRRDFRPHRPGRQGLCRYRHRSRPGEGDGADARPCRGGDQGGARRHERGRHADRRDGPPDWRRCAWPWPRSRARRSSRASPARAAARPRPLPGSSTSSRSRLARAASASRRSPAISPSVSPGSA